jgi:hypothetical protein
MVPSQSVDSIMEKILKCSKDNSYSHLIDHVTELVQAVKCRIHQKAALSATKTEARRTTRLQQIVSEVTHLSDEDRTIFQQWIGAISRSKSVTDEVTWITTASATSKRTVTKSATRSRPTTATPVSNTVKLSYVLSFTPYQDRWTNLTESDALRQKMAEPLLPSDRKQGYIYMF